MPPNLTLTDAQVSRMADCVNAMAGAASPADAVCKAIILAEYVLKHAHQDSPLGRPAVALLKALGHWSEDQ